MSAGIRPGTIDVQLALRIYGWLMGVGGIAVIVFGPDTTNAFGAMLVVIGCWAGALSQIADRLLRRKGLMWFAAANLMVVLTVGATWGSGSAPREQAIQFATFIVVVALLGRIIALAQANAKEPVSRYDQQMRQAGAQEERNRLARDLHDSIKQQIFVIQTAAATAQTRFDEDRAGSTAALDQIRDAARDAMTEMEVMMDNLRSVPLENAGLVEALKKQCETLGHRTGARVDFRLGELPPNDRLAPGSHQAFLRVAQEACANVGRHARAGAVTVSLGSVGDRLELRIQDDGAGFDQLRGSGGLGIANMRARAAEFGGQLDLTSAPGSGTTVAFSIPYAAAKWVPSPRRKALVQVMVGGMAVYGLVSVFQIAVKEHAKGKDVHWYIFAFIVATGIVRLAITYRKRRSDKAKV